MPLVTVPSSIRDFLSWMNWNAGDFIKFSVLGLTFGLPPFSFQPGNAILTVIDLFLWPINNTWDLAVLAWNRFSPLELLLDVTAYKINSWVLNAVSWLWDQLVSWWSATWTPIYGGLITMISHAASAADSAVAWMRTANEWLAQRLVPVWSWINMIIANYVTKVDLADLFGPIQNFMSFMDSVKQDMVDFFNDPWDWLYKKFDDFFERFW